MIRHPFQLAGVSDPTGYDRIGINRAVLDLPQGFLLGEQQNVLAGLGSLAVSIPQLRRLQRSELNRDQGESDCQSRAEHCQQDTPNLAVAAMASSRAAPDTRPYSPCFRFTEHFYLPSTSRPLGLAEIDTALHL
jgi:hypothetical protein